MECLIKNLIKNTVNNIERSFKSGILKNDRKIDITFYFLALKKGLVVRGQFEESREEVAFLRSFSLDFPCIV